MPIATVTAPSPPRRPRIHRKLERADDILSGRAERLGKNFPRHKDGVSVTSARAFSEPTTGVLSLDVQATVSPHVSLSPHKVRAVIADILQPLLDDAHARMRDDKVDLPIQVRLALTHTETDVLDSP